MKLTIQAPSTPAGDYKIYESGQSFPMRNMRANIVGLYDFSEDDIFNLLGPTKYAQFENGKFSFDIPKKHVQLITGERLAQTRAELQMYPY